MLSSHNLECVRVPYIWGITPGCTDTIWSADVMTPVLFYFDFPMSDNVFFSTVVGVPFQRDIQGI